jgi:hypothetical protein
MLLVALKLKSSLRSIQPATNTRNEEKKRTDRSLSSVVIFKYQTDGVKVRSLMRILCKALRKGGEEFALECWVSVHVWQLVWQHQVLSCQDREPSL